MPSGPFGSASVIRTVRGYLYGATRARTNSRSRAAAELLTGPLRYEFFAARARYAATVVRLAHALEQNRRVRFRDWSTKWFPHPAAAHRPSVTAGSPAATRASLAAISWPSQRLAGVPLRLKWMCQPSRPSWSDRCISGG